MTLGVAAPAILFAAVSKAGFGSGADFAALAILAIILPPQAALGLMLPLLILIDASAIRSYWGRWDPAALKVLLIGSVPGCAVGLWLLAVVDPEVVRFLIGILCLAFVAFQIARRSGRLRLSDWQPGPRIGLLSGFGAGFGSFISHAGGPLAAVYLLGRNTGKTTYQATTLGLFAIINLIKIGPYVAIGAVTRETLALGVWLVPMALLGTWLGVRAHYWMPERPFFLLTYALLLTAGSRLIWIGLG